MKFRGKPEDWKQLVSSTGLTGTWSDNAGNGQVQFRTPEGGVLNWWPSNGTVFVQGSAEGKTSLQSAVDRVLDVRPRIDTVKDPLEQRHLFVVHGHDLIAREQLELILRRLGLEPFVLQNTSGGGRTIIEALEHQIGKRAVSSFGIVLVTPDDMGYSKEHGQADAKARARQNVILEMGMLFSSLTRERVVLLVKGFVDMPSDVTGIIYLHFNDHVKETVPKLVERLQLAGFEIDPPRLSLAMS